MGWLFGRRKAKPVAPASAEAIVEAAQPPVAEPSDAAPDQPPIEVDAEVGDPPAEPAPPVRLTPDQALAELVQGNLAFLRGENNLGHVTAHDLEELQRGQHPIATIVGCADSRTPPTILFNQGFGRLFSIRVAGNTVDRRGLASIVYSVKHLHCPLVVVMGHTGCGAVAAAEAVVDGEVELDPSLEEMIVPIIPAVLTARRASPADPAVAAVEENTRRVAAKLATADTSLGQAIAEGALKIVAAVKDMRSGQVRFLDGAVNASVEATAETVAGDREPSGEPGLRALEHA